MTAATLRNKASPSNALLMRFQPTDTASKVSRAMLASSAKHWGYKRESEVLHYAVRKLADDNGAGLAKLRAATRPYPHFCHRNVKKEKGRLSYGSIGLGMAHHLIGEQFNDMADLAGFDIASWFGLMASAGTPPEILN